MKRRFWTIAAGVGATLTLVVLMRAQPEELDSLKVCAATQKLIFENAFVRVIDDRIPVGVAEPKHKHLHGLTVVLTDYEVEQKNYPDGKITRPRRKFGDATWSEAVVHEVKNVGTTPSHAIRIELK